MATTANYGWTIPDDTDLVKNGALAIRTLGNAIDTTAAASFGGSLNHITTITFTASSSESLNDIFTSDYRNYKILMEATFTGTNDNGLYLRWRKAGTDNSTGNYHGTILRTTTVAAANVFASQTQAYLNDLRNVATNYLEGVIYAPQINSTTAFVSVAANNAASTSRQYVTFSGGHNVVDQFDGMTIFPVSGTMTGQISVFGIKE